MFVAGPGSPPTLRALPQTDHIVLNWEGRECDANNRILILSYEIKVCEVPEETSCQSEYLTEHFFFFYLQQNNDSYSNEYLEKSYFYYPGAEGFEVFCEVTQQCAVCYTAVYYV